MIYGEEKAKEIARSILPAKRRKGPRESLANAKRKVRHKVKTKLKTTDDWDDAILDDYPDEEIGEIVFERRLSDNVGAAMRWAERKVVKESIRKEDRVKYIESIFPNNLAGQHAVYGHIVHADGIQPDYEHNYRYYRLTPEQWKERAKAEKKELEEIKDKLLRIIDRGHHKEFNRRLKGAFIAPTDWYDVPTNDERVLLGVHDIDDFAPLCLGGYNRSRQCRVLEEFDV